MTEPAPTLTVVIPALNERRVHAFDVLDLRDVGFCDMIFKARRRP